MAEKPSAYSKEAQEKREEADKSWSELLPELLHLISSHLLAGDFLTFRAVCKSWRSSTHLNRAVSPLVNGSASMFPSLMSMDWYKCRFYHPTYYGASHMDIPTLSPELLGAQIRFSKYGWLLLTRNDWSVFFFNPFTKVKVELPRPTYWRGFETMSFSAPPTSSDCFVFGSYIPGAFGITKPGESNWQYRYITGRAFELGSCNPVLHKGLCYALGVDATVGVLDPHDTSCQWTIYAPKTSFFKDPFECPICQSYLVETDGKLLAVFVVDEDATSIYIFELNLSIIQKGGGKRIQRTSLWRRVRTLGDKTMYLSLGGSFVEPAVLKGMSNKIYLPMIQDNQNVFYSLNSRLYKSFPSDFSSKFPFHALQLQNCCWIKDAPEFTSY